MGHVGHTRGVQSAWSVQARGEQESWENVWGAGSFRREDGGPVGSTRRSGGGGEAWINNDQERSRFSQQISRQIEDVWGNGFAGSTGSTTQ